MLEDTAERLQRSHADAGERLRRRATLAEAVGSMISGTAALGLRMMLGPVAETMSFATSGITGALTCLAVHEITGGLRDGGEMMPVFVMPLCAGMAMSHCTINPLIGLGILTASVVALNGAALKYTSALQPRGVAHKAEMLRGLADRYRQYEGQRDTLMKLKQGDQSSLPT